MSGPRVVNVDVIVESVSPVVFRFESTEVPVGPDNVIYFRNCGHAGFHVHYTLRGPTGGDPPENFLFPPFPPPSNLDLVLASQLGAGCPSQSSGQWEQFRAQRIINQRTLVVHNKNEDPYEFCYSLFITDGADWKTLDPGGVNQNGPSRNLSLTHTLLLVGGAAAGCLATLGGQALTQG